MFESNFMLRFFVEKEKKKEYRENTFFCDFSDCMENKSV